MNTWLRGLLPAAIAIFSLFVPANALADDADPILVRQWLCQFFSTPHDGRAGLLSSAPLPFEPHTQLTVQERPVSGSSNAIVHVYTMGRRYADWYLAYSYQTRPDGRIYGFHLKLEGDHTVLLPDEPSVQQFLRAFDPPSYDAELARYETGVPDPEHPDYDPDRRLFEIQFSTESQDLSISWLRDEDGRFGRGFCN